MNLQRLASDILYQVEQGSTLTTVLPPFLTKLAAQPSDRAALQDMAYGCQRYLAELKFMLSKLVQKPVTEDKINRLLLVALYQLMHTKNAEYAVVNNAVNESKTIAQGKFQALVNGVLRNAIRQKTNLIKMAQEDQAASTNHPVWWVKRLQQDFPAAWQAIIQAGNSHPPMTLRINRQRTTSEGFQSLLREAGITFTRLDEYTIKLDKALPVTQIPGFQDGLCSVQDFGAQQAAIRLDIHPGQSILDACAAPGGKSGHILEMASVNLTALDIDAERLKRVDENLHRLGLSAKLLACDAKLTEKWWDGQLFDRILADVPCTASGVVRRHPDIKWLRQASDAKKLAIQQRALLDNLWKLLAPHGKMLFTTCSVFNEENQQQISHFLSRNPDAMLTNDEQLLPDDEHDGFYYALLEKTA